MKGASFVVAAAVLAVAVVSATPQQPQAQRRTGLIVGHVTDGNTGAPIPGAIVTIAASSPAGGFRVGTDDDGGFVFTGLAAGLYGVTVTKAGYAGGGFGQRRPDGTILPIELTEGQRLADVKLFLWKLGSVGGTVLDEAGEPVVGVSVSALRWMMYTGRRRLMFHGTALTDDRGVYRIGSMSPGEYVTVVPATQTALPASVYERYWRDPTNNDLRSAIAGALSTNTPIPPPGHPQARPFVDVVIIGAAQGVVQPDPGASGALTVLPTTFHGAGMSPTQAGVVALGPGEHKLGVDIRLSPVTAARVTGTLTGPGGPVGLFPVRLIPKWVDDFAGGSGIDAATTLTDEAGRFTFVGVTPGAYVARATRTPRPGPTTPGAPVEPALWAFESVTIGTEDAAMALTLRPGLRVTGRFEFDGAAPRPTPERLRQIPVMIEPIDARPIASVAPRQADVDGTFGTFGLPPGRYFVRIGGPPQRWVLKSVTHEGRDITEVAVELKDADLSGVVITFTDQPTEINGRVRTPEGSPDRDAAVLIFPADPDAWVDFGLNPGRLRTARADTLSRYGLRVVPGDYYVIAVPEESTADWRDPKVMEALSRRATRLRLLPGETKVLDLTTVR